MRHSMSALTEYHYNKKLGRLYRYYRGSVADPDVWDRIRILILALINDPISPFYVCKSHKYFSNICVLTFWVMNILFRRYFRQKNFQEKLC
jgi:hypothetical protein